MPNHELYSPGYGKELISLFQTRSVQKEAAFIIPYIPEGSLVLDCGCGPGSITMGIASHVNIKKVVGVDLKENQIEIACNRAIETGYKNVEFIQGNIYNLDFMSDTFDVVFANGLMQHLSKPDSALTEMKRVLKKGGVIGLRDDDHGSMILAPMDDNIEKLLKIFNKQIKYSGGNPYMGRQHKGLLVNADFHNIRMSISCEYDETYEEIRRRADVAIELLQNMTKRIIDLKWATPSEVESMLKAINKWGSDLGAFNAIMWCEAVATKY